MIELIKRALTEGSTKTGINAQWANAYIQRVSSGRYKIKWCAASCSWAFNESGIVVYKGRKYYYLQNGDNKQVSVEYH